jgi:hypothetical protein
MNMDMVFQSVCQVVRTILAVWIMQIKWAGLIGLHLMQIKPGDFGGDKRGIGTFVSAQATDGQDKRLSVFY